MRKYLILIILCISCMTYIQPVTAQCPMCKLSAESNYNNGDDKAIGLNTGILYLLCMPLIVVTSIGYYMWKKNKDEVKALREDSEMQSPTPI